MQGRWTAQQLGELGAALIKSCPKAQGLTEESFQMHGWPGAVAPAATQDETFDKLSDSLRRRWQDRAREDHETFGSDEAARERLSCNKVMDGERVMLELAKSLNIAPQSARQ